MHNSGATDEVLQRLERMAALRQEAKADVEPAAADERQAWAARQLERCRQLRAVLIPGDDWTWTEQCAAHRQMRADYVNWQSKLSDYAIRVLSSPNV